MTWEMYTVIKLNLLEDLANHGDNRYLDLISNAYHWAVDINAFKSIQYRAEVLSFCVLNTFVPKTTSKHIYLH